MKKTLEYWKTVNLAALPIKSKDIRHELCQYWLLMDCEIPYRSFYTQENIVETCQIIQFALRRGYKPTGRGYWVIPGAEPSIRWETGHLENLFYRPIAKKTVSTKS